MDKEKRKDTCPFSSKIQENDIEIRHIREDLADLKDDTEDIKSTVNEMNNGGLKETLMEQNMQFMKAYMDYQEQMVEQEELRLSMEKEDRERNADWRKHKWKIISGVLASLLTLLTALVSSGII